MTLPNTLCGSGNFFLEKSEQTGPSWETENFGPDQALLQSEFTADMLERVDCGGSIPLCTEGACSVNGLNRHHGGVVVVEATCPQQHRTCAETRCQSTFELASRTLFAMHHIIAFHINFLHPLMYAVILGGHMQIPGVRAHSKTLEIRFS